MSLSGADRGFGNDMFSARVRENAGSAGFGAACLLVFGFGMFSPPAVTSAFSFGDALGTWTMRVGGMAMVVTALMSFNGKAWVLLVDGILSVPIGVGLAVAGVVMVANGGSFIQLLYPVFGSTFVSAGVRNVRAYTAIRRGYGSAIAMDPVVGAGIQRGLAVDEDVMQRPPVVARKRTVTDDAEGVAPRERVVTPLVVSSDAPATPPPSGYLASFAKKGESDSSSSRPE